MCAITYCGSRFQIYLFCVSSITRLCDHFFPKGNEIFFPEVIDYNQLAQSVQYAVAHIAAKHGVLILAYKEILQKVNEITFC